MQLKVENYSTNAYIFNDVSLMQVGIITKIIGDSAHGIPGKLQRLRFEIFGEFALKAFPRKAVKISLTINVCYAMTAESCEFSTSPLQQHVKFSGTHNLVDLWTQKLKFCNSPPGLVVVASTTTR